jgi:hypothetical protein
MKTSVPHLCHSIKLQSLSWGTNNNQSGEAWICQNLKTKVLQTTVNNMKIERQIEQARYLIDRYDRLLQMVDIKGNIIAIYHFTIIGAIVFNYDDLKILLNVLINDVDIFFWLVLSVILISLASLLFIFLAIFPFLESKTKKGKDHKSLIFFKAVCEMGQKNFETEFSNQSEEDLVADYKAQIFNIAKGLSMKFVNIKRAGHVSYLHLLVGVILIIIKIL